MGLAPGAEFLLARTEIATEPFSEEENWLAAVEWADKNGADIINSSLGYTFHRYFPENMDGKTSLVARAANLAAAKGILVVNAMGNEGSSKWKTLGTPADADSVLSIGGYDPDSDYHISFSSYGPTTDKRMKPNVSAFGHVIAAGKSGLKTVDGTSFSSPLVAGFAACAWQSNRGLNNMQLFKEIEKSGDLYPYFDYAHGYGVPQANYFVTKENKEATATFEIVQDGSSIKVKVIEAFLPVGDKEKTYLYYHIENAKGVIDKYVVIKVYQSEVQEIKASDLMHNEKLVVHYKGYTATFKL